MEHFIKALSKPFALGFPKFITKDEDFKESIIQKFIQNYDEFDF